MNGDTNKKLVLESIAALGELSLPRPEKCYCPFAGCQFESYTTVLMKEHIGEVHAGR